MHSNPIERRRRLLDESIEEMAALRVEREARREGPPREGDLFFLQATAGLPVEWALLERHAEDPGRFLAVPADTFPWLGPGDLAVDPEGPAGSLSLRCRFGVWLDESWLEPRLRTGALAPEARERALPEARRSMLAPAADAGDEAMADPPYRDWVEGSLQPARSIAASLARFRRRPPRRFPFSSLAAAAAVLLALLNAGLFVELARQQRQVAELRTQSGEARQLAAREQERAVGLRRERERLHSRLEEEASERQRLEQQLATRPATPAAEPLVNQPLVFLSPAGSARAPTSPATSLRLDAQAQWIGVVLSFAEDEPAASYRVDLLRPGSAAPIWSRGKVTRTGESEIRLLLPRAVLPAGAYRFRLFGTTRGARKVVAEYDLVVSEK